MCSITLVLKCLSAVPTCIVIHVLLNWYSQRELAFGERSTFDDAMGILVVSNLINGAVAQ